MIGKFVYLLAFLVSIAAVANGEPVPSQIGNYAATNASHNLIVGARQPGDSLVLRQSVIKSSSWMQIVTVQQTFNSTYYRPRITQIRALDQKTNGNGAFASLLNGGPGRNNVTMRFKSQRGHGINFIVELYARP